MSTNHTPNYALSLWEASDQVLRTEFNENHAKIDAALAAIQGAICRPQLLQEYPVTQGSRIIYLPLDEINWDNWNIVVLTMDYMPAIISDGDYFYGSLVGVKVCSSMGIPFFKIPPYPFALAFLPFHDSGKNISALCFADPGGYCIGRSPFRNISTMTIQYSSSGAVFSEGTKISIWGMR